MHGNVWEWCTHAGREYREQAEVDPKGVSATFGGPRGGSWISSSVYARSAFRDFWPNIDGGWYCLGFRLLLRSSKLKKDYLT